jgi:hypothetical protein
LQLPHGSQTGGSQQPEACEPKRWSQIGDGLRRICIPHESQQDPQDPQDPQEPHDDPHDPQSPPPETAYDVLPGEMIVGWPTMVGCETMVGCVTIIPGMGAVIWDGGGGVQSPAIGGICRGMSLPVIGGAAGIGAGGGWITKSSVSSVILPRAT